MPRLKSWPQQADGLIDPIVSKMKSRETVSFALDGSCDPLEVIPQPAAVRCPLRPRSQLLQQKPNQRKLRRKMKLSSGSVGILLSLLAWAVPVSSSAQVPSIEQENVQKVILDTDIGSNVDDAYALTLLVSLRKTKLLGVTTVSGATEQRALLAAKLLMKLGSSTIPVYAGRPNDRPMNGLYEWALGFHSTSLQKVPAVEFLREQI